MLDRALKLGAAMAALALIPRAHGAQSLADRIASTRNGTVRMTFAARAGVCGDGRRFIADRASAGEVEFYTGDVWGRSTGTAIGADCVAGPVRVVATLSGREVTALRVYAGGPEAVTPRADRDLGTVSAGEAARYLLDLAQDAGERTSATAMLAANLADSVRLAPTLMGMARKRALRPSVRASALKWLVRAAEREGERGADDVLRSIAADESDVTAVRERAIRELTRVDGGDDFLRQLYGRLDDMTLKERAIRTIGEMESATNRDWIRRVALSRSEPLPLRERAVRILGELEQGRALRDMYSRLDEVVLKERIVRAVGESGDAASAEWLRAVAENADEPLVLRERAIRVLAERGETAYLRAAYTRLRDAQLRERIVRVVAEGGGSESLRWLRQVALDDREDVGLRERAVRSASEAGIATTELVSLYDAVGERVLRERLLALLAERGGKVAMDKLVDVARRDPDPDLRKRAVRKLSESGDPRARELLAEMLRAR